MGLLSDFIVGAVSEVPGAIDRGEKRGLLARALAENRESAIAARKTKLEDEERDYQRKLVLEGMKLDPSKVSPEKAAKSSMMSQGYSEAEVDAVAAGRNGYTKQERAGGLLQGSDEESSAETARLNAAPGAATKAVVDTERFAQTLAKYHKELTYANPNMVSSYKNRKDDELDAEAAKATPEQLAGLAQREGAKKGTGPIQGTAAGGTFNQYDLSGGSVKLGAVSEAQVRRLDAQTANTGKSDPGVKDTQRLQVINQNINRAEARVKSAEKEIATITKDAGRGSAAVERAKEPIRILQEKIADEQKYIDSQMGEQRGLVGGGKPASTSGGNGDLRKQAAAAIASGKSRAAVAAKFKQLTGENY